MTRVERAIGFLLAIAAAFALARLSTLSLSSREDQAVLRLAWTARPERIEECRQQTEEELAKLPAHMRQSVACIGTTATYRLEVRWNDRVLLQQTVRGGGLRHDRPLYLLHDLEVPPGDGDMRVRFDRIESIVPPTGPASHERDEEHHGSPVGEDRRVRELEEHTRGREEAIPPSLSFERRLHVESRKVVLVTYDAERRDLVVVDDGPR